MPHAPRSFRQRWGRRLRWLAAGASILLVGLVAALPWIAGTSVVRRAVLAQVNRMYAPTVIELEHVAPSWTGPVRLRGVVLRDGHGKAVVTSPSATLDRSLWQLLTMRPDYGTLTLHGAFVDVERRADGSIDLAEALGPILAGDDDKPADDRRPPTRFTLAIEAGSLLLKSPELAEPLTAERLDMTLHCAPAPLRWEIALSNPDARTLLVTGHYDSRDPEAAEALVAIAGSRWPLAVARAGLRAEGVFGGELGVRMVGGDLELKGEAVLTGVSADGPALKGDRPRLDRVEAAWDLDLAAGGLAIRRLDLDAPIARVGLAPDAPDGGSKWVGRVDLAALAGELPNTLALRDGLQLQRGSADLEVVLGPAVEDGSTPVALEARLGGLSARDGSRVVTLDEPISVSARLLQGVEGAGIAVESAAIASGFLDLDGRGDLDRGVTFEGSIDLDALDEQLRQWVDLGEIALSGAARFGGDYRRGAGGGSYTTRLAVEGRALRLAGLTEEPIARDAARFDLVVQGPAAPPGLPTGWDRLRASTEVEGVDAVVEASPIADALALRGRLTMPRPAPDDARPVAEPPALAFDAVFRAADDRLDLTEVRLEHELGRVRASGRIDAISSSRIAALTGSFEPDWDAISARLAEATEPQARLDGTPRPFRLNGPLSGASTRAILAGIDAELGIDLAEAVVFGLRVGPAPLVARLDRGAIRIDPIDTTLNGGRVVVTPGVVVGEDDSVILTVGEGSGFDGVEITEDVSRRFLAYIAPVLREATQVNGRMSARVDRLSVPLAGPPAALGGDAIDLAARVALREVTYGPGPMMQNILGLAGLPPQQVPRLMIDQVVDVAIAEGRVHQSGLEIVAAEGVALQLEGSVGLDQTLALRVGVPLSDRLLGGKPILTDVLGGTRVGLPIGGTLGHPQLDQEAFRVGLRQQAGRLLGRGAAVGADQLFRLLDGERDGPPAGDRPGDPSPVPPATEELLRGVGRGLLRDVLGGGPDRRPGDDRPGRP